MSKKLIHMNMAFDQMPDTTPEEQDDASDPAEKPANGGAYDMPEVNVDTTLDDSKMLRGSDSLELPEEVLELADEEILELEEGDETEIESLRGELGLGSMKATADAMKNVLEQRGQAYSDEALENKRLDKEAMLTPSIVSRDLTDPLLPSPKNLEAKQERLRAKVDNYEGMLKEEKIDVLKGRVSKWQAMKNWGRGLFNKRAKGMQEQHKFAERDLDTVNRLLKERQDLERMNKERAKKKKK